MSGLLLTWNCRVSSMNYDNRKVTKELLNGLEPDDDLSFKIVNGKVTCEDSEFTSLIEQLFTEGLIPDNSDLTIFHTGESLNIIGDFLEKCIYTLENDNDIDYFIEIVG